MDADLDPNPILGYTQFLHMLKNLIFNFFSQLCHFNLFYHYFQRHRCQHFYYFGQFIEYFRKKYRFALLLVKIAMDPDPEQQAPDADPDLPK